ncbi:MAG: HupE/UreJ family protein [Chitinophagaceae bacterium]|nr:MAG: HupE/UreJ family protein [Chitinophagaceae bacterium]
MKPFRILVLSSAALLLFQTSEAHTTVTELENLSRTETAWLYLGLGFRHILPWGLDHILFVLSLFLLSPNLKVVIRQSLAFTVAHSITLGLALYGFVQAPPAIVEPLITLSIAVVAIENIWSGKLRASRMAVVFLFGLVHGLGFASSLSSMGLPQQSFLSSLLAFNVGVELGQLAVLLTAFLLVGKWFGQRAGYRKFFVIPASALIALVAVGWTVARLIG